LMILKKSYLSISVIAGRKEGEIQSNNGFILHFILV
jgi:hypothetical protein